MKYNRYFGFALSLLFSAGAFAQTSYDAATMIGSELMGTARYVGMAGAMGAFGNDLSVISTNPAGIGTYKTCDVNTSFSLSNSKTRIGAFDKGLCNVTGRTRTTDLKAGFDNIGFVLSSDLESTTPTYLNVAFYKHKIKDSQRDKMYYDDFVADDKTVFRDHSDFERTILDAYSFNLSMNINDRVYWGATCNLLEGTYLSEGYTYDYYPVQDGYAKDTDYNSADRQNSIHSNGWNVSTGLILRGLDGHLRVGVSFQTPTLYSVRQQYTDYLYALDGEAKDGKEFVQETEYKVVAPSVTNFCVGLSGAHSALGFEYELSRADKTKLRQNREDMADQGSQDLRAYSTWKLGYETNVKNFSFRLGYAKSRSMFREEAYKYLGDTDFNKNRMDKEHNNIGGQTNMTVGVGYCSKPVDDCQFYLDLAAVNTKYSDSFSLGYISFDPVGSFNTRNTRFILTAGMTF